MADPTTDPLDPDNAFGPLVPNWTEPPAPVPASRRYVTVQTPTLYQDPLSGKLRGVAVERGSGAWLRLPLTDPATGGPLTLQVGPYSSAPSVAVRFREATGVAPSVYEPDDLTDPVLSDDGTAVLFPVPPEVMDGPGVYTCQARVVAADGGEAARESCFLIVDRGLWAVDGNATDDRGPPTTRELRLAARDHPGANRLLANYDFDYGEIAQSIVAAVQDFNTAMPIVPGALSTTTWPTVWRRQLMEGCLAHLFRVLAHYYRRSDLPYSAGGLTIADLSKEKQALQASEMLRQDFLQFCRFQKTRASISAGWGSTSSGWPWIGTY